MYIPTKAFLTKGVGRHQERLTSFEMALRSARIAEFNLVKVSSIFPPRCKIVPRAKGLKHLSPGQITHCVLSEVATNEPHRLISASIGIAIPKDRERYGYLAEHHAYGQTEKKSSDYVEDLAAEMLATILGVDIDESLDYDSRRDIWRMSEHIVKTTSLTQSAVGQKNGLWTTALACCVLVA